MVGSEAMKKQMDRISDVSNTLERLSEEDLERIADLVVQKRMVEDLDRKAKVSRIDYRAEKEMFLMSTSKTNSSETRWVYRDSLRKFDEHCRRYDVDPLLMTHREADDFIYKLAGSPNTRSLTISAVSSFFSYLERRYDAIRNPIRGTRARPRKVLVRETKVPTEEEVAKISDLLGEMESLAVKFMARRGLRVGALVGMTIRGRYFKTISKGKAIEGEVPSELLDELSRTHLDQHRPFSCTTTREIKDRVIRASAKLKKSKEISRTYSSHCLRHFFAVNEYLKDKDIYRVSKLLNHESVTTTETYLRSLDVKL
jgi:site-specific recombinase XerD